MNHNEVMGKMMRLKLPKKSSGGRPRRRFIDALKEDMRVVGVWRMQRVGLDEGG